MASVLVTGATGFVGGRLVRQLLAAGYGVRALARTPAKASALAEAGAEVVQGDVTDPASLREAMRGVEGVFHLAAAYELGGDPERMRAINVDGTRNVLDAAVAAEVPRVLYCGSDTSLGDTRGEVRDESQEHDTRFRSVYERTKHDAHALVVARMREGAPVVNAIVSTVYGPEDESPVAELIEHHLAGRARIYLDRTAGYTYAHVDDVATALRLAYERGEPGESYLVSGTPASFERFFETLSAESGLPPPRVQLPSWGVALLRPLAALLAPLLGKSAAEVREMVSMGRGVTRYFSGAKARERLGWSPRPLAEGLRDTLPWFQAREAEAADRLLRWTVPLLAALCLFDVALGTTAVFLPDVYLGLMHPQLDAADTGPIYLLTRTGVLWYVFAFVQGVAALRARVAPEWVLAAGVLRLMDVPADPTYFFAAPDLGWLGAAGLLTAPVFNLASGAFFLYAGVRRMRAWRWKRPPAGPAPPEPGPPNDDG